MFSTTRSTQSTMWICMTFRLMVKHFDALFYLMKIPFVTLGNIFCLSDLLFWGGGVFQILPGSLMLVIPLI